MEVQEEILKKVKREVYKRSYFEFFKKACQEMEPHTPWDWGFHMEYLCNILEKEIHRVGRNEDKQHDYVINIPPRVGKSLIFTVILNAWAWIHYPHLKFMTISYAEGLASDFAYQTKLIIKSEWYEDLFSDIYQLKKDDTQKGNYSNTAGGYRKSFGITGAITGKGADIIICDDLNKPDETTPLMLQQRINSYRDTIYNRLNNPKVGLRIVMQQRTHSLDVSGYVLENYDDEIYHVCLPMELSDKVKPFHLANEYKNDYLHYARFDSKSVKKYQKVLGTRSYNAQYLQDPGNEESALLKKSWFEPYIKWDNNEFANLNWHLFLDTAYTDKQENDPSVIMVAAKWNNSMIIKKVYRYWLNFPELIKKIKEVYSGHCTNRSRIYIEPKASGLSIMQQLRIETTFNIQEIKGTLVKDGKEARVNSTTPLAEANRILLIKDASWNENFIKEITSFPVGKHDDQVDCMCYGANILLTRNNGMQYIIG